MVAKITLQDVLPILVLVCSTLGGAKVLEILFTKMLGRRTERRKDERDDDAADRAEIEQWQTTSSRWQGEAMTLQGELKKRDDLISEMRTDIESLKRVVLELKGEMADVLSENRRYRIRLEMEGMSRGVGTGKAD